MRKRVKIGDIVEIPTKKGLAYAQYTHKVPSWGALLRVKEPLFEERPSEFDGLAAGKNRFITFFPLQAAVNQKIFEVVANADVPEGDKEIPLFRAPGFVDRDGNVHDWWLVDGEKEWQIGKLNAEQKHLPIQEVLNDTALIEQIEENWRPEHNV